MKNKTIEEIKKVLTERKCIYTECEKMKKDVLNLLKNKVILDKEEIEKIIEWGDNERKNNNIFRKSVDELNEDWIEKLQKLTQGGD